MRGQLAQPRDALEVLGACLVARGRVVEKALQDAILDHGSAASDAFAVERARADPLGAGSRRRPASRLRRRIRLPSSAPRKLALLVHQQAVHRGREPAMKLAAICGSKTTGTRCVFAFRAPSMRRAPGGDAATSSGGPAGCELPPRVAPGRRLELAVRFRDRESSRRTRTTPATRRTRHGSRRSPTARGSRPRRSNRTCARRGSEPRALSPPRAPLQLPLRRDVLDRGVVLALLGRTELASAREPVRLVLGGALSSATRALGRLLQALFREIGPVEQIPAVPRDHAQPDALRRGLLQFLDFAVAYADRRVARPLGIRLRLGGARLARQLDQVLAGIEQLHAPCLRP